MWVLYTPLKGQEPFKMMGTGRTGMEAKQAAALRLLEEMGFRVRYGSASPAANPDHDPQGAREPPHMLS